MTTEDDFHDMLDECPTDWHTRKVFADFLQERDDPRAEGIRALAYYETYPPLAFATWFNESAYDERPNSNHWNGWLPQDWFDLIEDYTNRDGDGWKDFEYRTTGRSARARAEDAAALAFLKLSEKRRMELLQPLQLEATNA